MEAVNITLRLLAVSQTLLFIIILVTSNNLPRMRFVGASLMVCFICYLIMPLIEIYTQYGDQLQWIWFPASISAEVLLLFVWCTFEEDRALPNWISALVIIGIGGSLWLRFYNIGLPDSPLWLQVTKIVNSALALGIVWHGRQHDLVARRYRIRNIFVLTMTIMILLVITVEVITDFNMPIKMSLLSVFFEFVFALALNIYFIKLNPNMELVADSNHSQAYTRDTLDRTDESVDPVIVSLLDRMIEERLYADHDLRVASLAELMEVPEYQLRKRINQELGYRNFNQFVNRYRIEEAGQRLLEDARLPVLTIALDVGFRSISSFNTAFQTYYGVSPTRYRAEATGSA